MKVEFYIRIKMLVLFSGMLAGMAACLERQSESGNSQIAVNLTGYLPEQPKIAVTPAELEPDDLFQLIDAETLQPLFEARVQTSGDSSDLLTGQKVHILDFSEFQAPGLYRLRLPGTGDLSSPFRIGHSVYNEPFRLSLESFYFQRCGTEVGGGTAWSHPGCHLDDAPLFENPERKRDVTGGWHDAGDYAKFVVTTVVSAAYMLYLRELRGDLAIHSFIGNPDYDRQPRTDLLSEVQWGLEWLLKMQNEHGGVHFKVSEKRWSGEYLPHQDPDDRYLFEVSTTATAGFSAVTAIAARHFRKADPEFAKRLERASIRAWQFLLAHPEILPEGGFTNPPGVEGGEFADSRDLDERLWAVVELYRLTGSDEYHDWFKAHFQHPDGLRPAPISWQEVDGFAVYSYLQLSAENQHPEVKRYLAAGLINLAEQLVDKVHSNGYRISLSAEEFYWGSNSIALGYGFLLLQAYEWSGREEFRWAALDQLHYIAGRNPFRISWVTGVGSRSVSQPYHQFSMELDHREPVPGMVVGGPNFYSRLEGGRQVYYPAKAWEDRNENYRVNEPAINYTAPYLFLSGYFSDFESEESAMNYIAPVILQHIYKNPYQQQDD